MNKKGGMTDLFIFMIFALIIVLISVVWIYIGSQAEEQLQATLGQIEGLQDVHGNNASVVIDNTIGAFNVSIQALQWISVFLIFGMILSIFIGSFLVTTKPIFFIPYIFIVIIATIVAVPLANTYEIIMTDEILSGTFTGFVGANFIMLNLPVFIIIIGITGGIIMFTRLGKAEEQYYGY